MRKQKVKHYYFLVIVFTISIFYNINAMRVGKASKQPFPLIGDALIPPDIPPKHNSSITPGYYETSEYLIGSVAVGLIFLESNGTIDPSTEDWTSTEESQVVSEIQVALNWWSSQTPSASVSFTWTINYSVPTNYEPINRHGGPPKDGGEENLWIQDAMNYLGYPGTDYFVQVRNYVNALRNSTGTNWAFAMFIVDSSNDPDGKFADGSLFAYAYLGGPFLVMTYKNNGWGIGNMDRVTAHEIGHIFYATDEYNGETEYSGYLNVSDVDGSGALMDTNDWRLSTGTQGQIGWRDTDSDGIQDIVDTFPNTTLNPYSPDPTDNTILVYTGSVTEVPYPNNNPKGLGRDVTINTITSVQFRIDYGAWINANATDGILDEAVEDFTFTTSSLSSGTHIIETRGINSAGNTETSYSSDTLTITGDPVAHFTYSPENPLVNETITFNATLSTPNGGAIITYDWDFGDGYADSGIVATHAYNFPGIFTVTLNITDSEGRWDTESKNITVKSHPVANFTHSPMTPYVGGTVTFNAQTSYDLDGSITSYKWDFGDGNITTITDPVVTHVFATENTYTVNLTVTDNDGLSHSITKSVTVTLDSQPPITLHDYDGLWHTTDFTINLTATDDLSGVVETYYKINDGPTKNVSIDGQPIITTEGFNNSLEYWSIDNADNEELPHKILTGIKLDKTAPTGSITIKSTDAYITSTSVTLTLTATDETSGVYQVRFSNDDLWDVEPWENFSSTMVWTLTSSDGTKKVYYQIKDNAGLVSETYSDTIILDTTPPMGSITINDEANYTTTNRVKLTISATDETSGIAEMRFSNDDTTWTSWEAYTPSKTWTLKIDDGIKTVYYQVKDHAGLVSETYSDTIVLDTNPPAILETFPSNGTEIKSSTITVSWSGTDETSGVDYYEIRLNGGFWINIGTNTTYTFRSGMSDGSHVLVIKAIDRANNYRQVRIHFSVNTSLIGGPGWTDDIVVFGILDFLIVGALFFFIKKKVKKR